MTDDTVLVRFSKDLVALMRTRTDDGRAIDWHLGDPDEDGVCELYAYARTDERTQQFRNGLAIAKLFETPAWGAQEAIVGYDYQEGYAFAQVEGFTTASAKGESIEDACLAAVEQLETQQR